MESCDTNILYHYLRKGDPLNAKAAAYFEQQAKSDGFVLCELVLAELYALLRAPAVNSKPLGPAEAVAVIRSLKNNRHWRILDYPGNLMDRAWEKAAEPGFPRTAIFDARLALTLRHYGVTTFATRNGRHFADYGFEKVYDPLV